MGVHGLRTRWGNYLTCTCRICSKDNWKAQSRKVAIAPSQQICQIYNFHIICVLFEHHRIIDLTKVLQLFPRFSSIFCQYSTCHLPSSVVSGGRTDVRSPSRSGYPPQAKDGPDVMWFVSSLSLPHGPGYPLKGHVMCSNHWSHIWKYLKYRISQQEIERNIFLFAGGRAVGFREGV